MKERTLRILEFNKIKDKVEKYAITSSGKEMVHSLKPCKSIYEVEKKLEETNEALELLITKGAPPFEGLYDTREALERAAKGGILTPEQLLKIGGMLRASRRFKEYMNRKEDEVAYKNLEDLAYILTPVKSLENDIETAIISEEEISDKNSSVREKINSIVRSNSKYLQDAIYTMRGERYVLPVKAEYKGAVPGLVHDQSSTGATLFIEPMSLVNLNNEIKELMLKEKAEIERILTVLSAKVTEHINECLNNSKILTELDFIFAKGKYASAINALKPNVSKDRSFEIFGAKHPLINPKEVVPSDVYLGKDFTTLMITGPNTGGKTVTLKTVGLLHLMALSGLLIPAKDGSTIGFFKEIYADIGDEQSIEQSLSTFSSHMTNIVSILEKADRDSLIIIDELGSGTDPAEGAALAISIIEELKSRDARVMVTTHYSELKGYALNTEGVENASVEFDVETLRPTYRLLIGIPGKSNAFEISRRLGLNDNVISKAKEYMSKDNLQFEDLIRDLQEKSIIANNNAREARMLKEQAEKLKLEYDQKLAKINKVREKAYEEARQEAKNIISNAKDEADEIVKAMRELERMGIAEGGRNRLEAKEAALRAAREEKGEAITKVTLGMEAMLPSLNQRVVIISMPDNKGEVQVEAGIMKINVKLKDLRKVDAAPVKKEKKKRELKLNTKSIESRIDLRGMDSEEACYRTDKYLDEAYLCNLGEVTVVHGKGTGILRKAINDMLKRHPHVKSYRLGVYGEGGDGVTIVELK